SDRAESRRHAHRRVHGPAHGHRYPEFAEPDRRSARIERARGRRAGVSYTQTLSKQCIAGWGPRTDHDNRNPRALYPGLRLYASLECGAIACWGSLLSFRRLLRSTWAT